MKETRARARTRGLSMAAKVAGIGAIVLAATGSAHATEEDEPGDERSLAEGDDGETGRPAARGGNCGCAPCWGPPAPPVCTRSVA